MQKVKMIIEIGSSRWYKFCLELKDNLIIDEMSDIYIDAVISMNTKLSTTT